MFYIHYQVGNPDSLKIDSAPPVDKYHGLFEKSVEDGESYGTGRPKGYKTAAAAQREFPKLKEILSHLAK
ncbi:hypothetical protein, partial [Streptococcus pneumoniae]|uniref:hypothetical protein n=1 Tax=Streptococcus pneumoniae TaxID=1313 RepID=UPI0012D72EFA